MFLATVGLLTSFPFSLPCTGADSTPLLRYERLPDLPLGEALGPVWEGHDLSGSSADAVVLRGAFVEVNGVVADGLARLLPDGTVAQTNAPGDAGTSVGWERTSSVFARDGSLYVVEANSEGDRARIRRWSPGGLLDEAYMVEAARGEEEESAPVQLRLHLESSGAVLVTGTFTSIAGQARSMCVRLEANGALDAAFEFEGTGFEEIEHLLPRPDGAWIVVARGHSQGYPIVRTVFRMAADGRMDRSFVPYDVFQRLVFSPPPSFVLDSIGRTVVFAEASSPEVPFEFLRLSDDGSRDESFRPELPRIVAVQTGNIPVSSLKRMRSDGAGGVLCFATFEDESYRGVVHVDASGGVGPWEGAASLDGWFRDVLRGAEGEWWADVWSLEPEFWGPRVVKLSGDGDVNANFGCETLGWADAYPVAVQDDGTVVVAGEFSEFSGQPARGVAWRKPDGTLLAPTDLPWPAARVVSTFEDGSVLMTPFVRPVTGIGRQLPRHLLEQSWVRVHSDGRMQELIGENLASFAVWRSWLDGAGRVVVVGQIESETSEIESTGRGPMLMRFDVSGREEHFHPLAAPEGEFWSVLASPTHTGAGVWCAFSEPVTGRCWFVEYDGTGAVVREVATRALGHWAAVHGIHDTRDGLVIAGEFVGLGGVAVDRVARLSVDGVVSPVVADREFAVGMTWAVSSFADGRIVLEGFFSTESASRSLFVISGDGSIDRSLPAEIQDTDPYFEPVRFSRSGRWLQAGAKGWRAVEVATASVVGPTTVPRPGETVTLRLDSDAVLAGITWLRDGEEVASVAGGSWTFATRAEDDGAVFVPRIQTTGGEVVYGPSWRLRLAPPAARLVNASARGWSGAGEQTLVFGFSLGGTGEAGLLARVLGTALEPFGVSTAARAIDVRVTDAHDRSELYPKFQDRWDSWYGGSHAFTEATAETMGAAIPELGNAPGDDQVLFPSLGAGSYSLTSASPVGAEGVVLAEVYAIDDGPGQVGRRWFSQFSGRGRVGAGGDVMIGGFVVEGTAPVRLLVRGVGPGLMEYGVNATVADPAIAVYDAAATVVAVNDDWGAVDAEGVAAAAVVVGAFPLSQGARDAALLVDLAPGAYTVVLRDGASASGETGIGLLEVYVVE
ncbi:hypothetical protein ASA1KI_12540 [Opitutales bacterium ASA1]|nr:hypothetical protein ASA1KI_12540 [Opitutales bacterium ASA1]